MEKFKKICKMLLFPHILIVIMLGILSAGALVWVFWKGCSEAWFSYPIYVLAFYSLTVVCVRLIPALVRRIGENKKKKQTQEDREKALHFRLSLYRALIINLAFGIFHLVSGILSDSAWMMSNGGYYMVLTLIHSILVIYERRLDRLDQPEKRERLGWAGFRLCGFLLLLLNIAMTVMAVQMILREQGKQYHEIVVITMAVYTFYRLTIAVIRVVQYKKNLTPILGAARNVDLTAAMMSLFSLQTAMFGSFGAEFDNQLLMNILTGSAVCLLAIFGSVGMVFHGRNKRKALTGVCENGK